MNKIDILRKHIGSDDFYDLNGTEMLNKILAAMDEYAEEKTKNLNAINIINLYAYDNCGCHPNVMYITSNGRFCERCKASN